MACAKRPPHMIMWRPEYPGNLRRRIKLLGCYSDMVTTYTGMGFWGPRYFLPPEEVCAHGGRLGQPGWRGAPTPAAGSWADGTSIALLSAMSALVGAIIGGGASLTAAVYTQRHQDRLQRVARETTKREQVYADFIMDASKLLLNAYVREELTLSVDEQHLVGLANRMRLFAPPTVIHEAAAVIRGLSRFC